MKFIGSFLLPKIHYFPRNSLHMQKKTYIINSICKGFKGAVMRGNLKSSHSEFKKNAKKTLYKGLDTKKKNKLTPKLSFMEELSNHLSLPADVLAGAPIITATGRNEICLENYKGIIEYNGDLIKVQTKACKICIEGKKLNILYFTEDEMRITGYIQAIYYQ